MALAAGEARGGVALKRGRAAPHRDLGGGWGSGEGPGAEIWGPPGAPPPPEALRSPPVPGSVANLCPPEPLRRPPVWGPALHPTPQPHPATPKEAPKTSERDAPTPNWDPETSNRDPMATWDPETSPEEPPVKEQDPKKMKRGPASPNHDPKTEWDPKTPPEDPPATDPAPEAPPEGDPASFRVPPLRDRPRWPRNPEDFGGAWPRRSGARTRLRNRRYAALRQLIAAGEYFSEEEMRAREPLLYEQYIGRYRGAEDPPPITSGPPHAPPQGCAPPGTPPGLTALLLRSVEEAAVQRRLRRQRLQDGDSEEEEEEEEAEHWVPNAAERALLREEFTSRMHQRFLDGQDGDFDYSQVDENPELDNLDIVSRDAEERYFDAEEPSAAPQLD